MCSALMCMQAAGVLQSCANGLQGLMADASSLCAGPAASALGAVCGLLPGDTKASSTLADLDLLLLIPLSFWSSSSWNGH